MDFFFMRFRDILFGKPYLLSDLFTIQSEGDFFLPIHPLYNERSL